MRESGRPRVTAILDQGWTLARATASPWWGIVWLGLIPWRALEIHFWNRTFGLADHASAYGDYLGSIALFMVVMIVPASWGRLVYTRACLDSSAGRRPSFSFRSLRIPPRVLLTHVAAKLIILAGLVLTSLSGVGLLVFVALGGLATVTAWSVERAGARGGLRGMTNVEDLSPLVGITFVFGIAFIVVVINLVAAISMIFWLADAVPLFHPMSLKALLFGRLFQLSIVGSALLILEPFWLATMTALVQTGRQRRTGSDLAARLEKVFSRPALAAVIALLLIAPSASADQISIDEYQQKLRSISSDLQASHIHSASRKASRLMEDEIVEGDRSYSPDRSLLRPIIDADEAAEADSLLTSRIEATLAALESSSSGSRTAAADRDAFNSEREHQRIAEIEAGGEVANLELDRGVWDDITGWIGRFVRWTGEKLQWLWDWIVSFWPEEQGEKGTEGSATTTVIIVAVMILLCLAALAAFVVRRSRRRATSPQVTTEKITSLPDEDPRSREESEWVLLAKRLASAGRYREAIRAWYNAILSTLFATSALTWVRGRTNWEYVGMLSSATSWKIDFVRLTIEFDREWYGNHAVDSEAYESFSKTASAILDSLALKEGAA